MEKLQRWLVLRFLGHAKKAAGVCADSIRKRKAITFLIKLNTIKCFYFSIIEFQFKKYNLTTINSAKGEHHIQHVSGRCPTAAVLQEGIKLDKKRKNAIKKVYKKK